MAALRADGRFERVPLVIRTSRQIRDREKIERDLAPVVIVEKPLGVPELAEAIATLVE